MSNYGNLWESALDGRELNTTANVVPLLQEQCDNLSKSTGGRVSAQFAPMEEAISESLRIVARSMAIAGSVVRPGWDDDRDNANELYSPVKYAFDIKSDAYRFRLFELMLKPVYPITVTFDEGVFSEARDRLASISRAGGDGFEVRVEDDDGLMRCVGIAVDTKKVRYILQRLLEEPKESGDQVDAK